MVANKILKKLAGECVLNILYHHRTQGTGAEGVHIMGIINGFRSLGHSVCIVSPPGVDPERTAGGNPFKAKKSLINKVLHFLARNMPQFVFEMIELGYNLRAHFRLKKIITSRRIDFIYERHSFFTFETVRLAKKYNIPIIVEVNEIAGEKRVRKQVFVKLAKHVENYVFQNADSIIVVSRHLEEKIQSRISGGRKIYVIPNAVDLEKFTPCALDAEYRKKLSLGDNAVIIGFIGWFVPWHRLDFLLDVFGEIVKKNDAYLILIGDGVLRDTLKEMTRDKGIDERVKFLGAIPHVEIPRCINAMDVCVIPESNEYRSPIKMFEYMAMGKAVVAPDLEPIRSVIADCKEGFIFKRGDRDDFIRSLSLAIDDEPLRKRVGVKARETIVAKYTWAKNAENVLNIYEKVRINGHYRRS